MSSLVLRYASPLMAFGHSGRFDNRPSAGTPTISGLQGMVAAAAGIGRDRAYPDWIAELGVAIRIDHAGTPLTDYHTVNQPPTRRYLALSEADLRQVRVFAGADGTRKDAPIVSRRGYVADATFVVTIDDPTGAIGDVLEAPVWHLYAGRKACPLTAPLLLGHLATPPETALGEVPTVAHAKEADRVMVGGQAVRDAIVFTAPDQPSGHEDRNDRLSRFGKHRPQRRWHTSVTVPVAADWFDVHAQLHRTEFA